MKESALERLLSLSTIWPDFCISDLGMILDLHWDHRLSEWKHNLSDMMLDRLQKKNWKYLEWKPTNKALDAWKRLIEG